MKKNSKFHAKIMPNSLKLIRPKELCEILSISIPTLYRWHSENKFPVKKIQIGPNSVAYRMADVEKWLEDQETETEIVQ